MKYSELNQMSIEDLRSLNKMVVEVIKSKRTLKGYEKKQQLYVGANVSVNHPKMVGKQLRVEKINRTKAKLRVLNGGGIWNVPLEMIEING